MEDGHASDLEFIKNVYREGVINTKCLHFSVHFFCFDVLMSSLGSQ